MRKLLLAAGIATLTIASTAAGFYLHQYYSGSGDQNQVTGRVPTGTLLPDFSLPDIHGKTRHPSEWQGRVLVLNFWATWCPPCLQEIPEFVSLQHKYANQGLQFVGIALQSASEVTGFVKSNKMNYPVLVGGMDVANLAESLGDAAGTLPYTVIVDRNKRIRFIKNGRLKGERAEQIIKSLL